MHKMSKQLKGLIYLLLYGTSFVRAITIRDELTTTTVSSSGNPVETSTYRITQPKAKNPSHRVPEYLQRVRNGFVYEDADDVIRVIEPPKHFEQLKMLMQSRQNIPAPEIRERGTVKTKPTRPLIKAKPKKSLRPQRTTTKKPVENDLEIQETEQLPVEILASVRKTENYLRKFKPKLPLAPLQRVKTKKIHTVIWEKAQEQQQYVQGQEKKVGGIRHFAESKQRRKFLKKRIKRAAASPQPLKGEDLLEHIDELVKNASLYLDNFKAYEDINAGIVADTSQIENLDEEKLPSSSFPQQQQPPILEDDIVKILENSVKATHVIMDQIKNQSNFTNIPSRCEYSQGQGSSSSSSRVHNLRQQIYCMQGIIKLMRAKKFHDLGKTEPPPTAYRHYGERLTVRKSKDLRRKPFLVAAVGDEYFEDSTPSPLNTSLIYDDVMTTIRNLLHATNLQTLEESILPTSTTASPLESETEFLSTWEDFSIPQDNSQEPVDFHNLNQYLNSLQTVVANLPQISNSSLNTHEIEGKSSKYYFINPLGGIHNLPQPFHPKGQRPLPPTAIFRKFPDIPSLSEYLGASGSLLKATQKVIEIL